MLRAVFLTAVLLLAAATRADPVVTNSSNNVTYQGFLRNNVELFLGVPYGNDTGGHNRFKPPVFAEPANGSTVNATAYGPACPQAVGRPPLFPLYITNVTEISEDCLNLNIARPHGTGEDSKLPVMVWIHGGSFWAGFNGDVSNAPDAMILESEANGLPMIHVAVNYRLGGECKPSATACI
jgi:carboxylesterase type B